MATNWAALAALSPEEQAALRGAQDAGLNQNDLLAAASSRGTGAAQQAINDRLGTTEKTLANGMKITTTNQPNMMIDPYAPDAYRAPLGLLDAPVSTMPQPGATPQPLAQNAPEGQLGLAGQPMVPEQWTPAWTPKWQPKTPEQQRANAELKSGLLELQGVDPVALQNYTNFRDYSGPTGSNAEADKVAQDFYTSVKGTPGAYDNLSSQEKMQYQYLRYVNGEISGNNKDDQIKKIWQNDPELEKEMIGPNGERSIWRNKPLADERKNGITAGDAFAIGNQNQNDTGKDDGAFASAVGKVVNPLLPGFNLKDVAKTLEPVTKLLDNPVVKYGLIAAGGYGFINSLATNGLTATLQLAASGELGAQGLAGMEYLSKLPMASDAVQIFDAVKKPNQTPTETEGPMIGDTPVASRPGWHWERSSDPDSVSGWKAVRDTPELEGGGGEPAGSTGGTSTTEGEAMEDRWTVQGGVLVNSSTGETREAGGNMKEGVVYNGDGDVVGQEEVSQEGTDTPLVIPGTGTSNGGLEGSGKKPLTMNDWVQWAAGAGLLAGGIAGGTGGGNGGGTGGGTGPGNGGGTEVPNPELPDVPPVVVPPTGETPGITPWQQDMSTNYVKPTYDPVTQKPRFEVYTPEMQAPMVLPAENSSQAEYQEWLDKYIAQGGTQEGLLAMISGSSGQGSGLI